MEPKSARADLGGAPRNDDGEKTGIGRYKRRVTLTAVPPRTAASAVTSPSALAKMLQGLASLISSPG
jgi:hypothetical protein